MQTITFLAFFLELRRLPSLFPLASTRILPLSASIALASAVAACTPDPDPNPAVIDCPSFIASTSRHPRLPTFQSRMPDPLLELAAKFRADHPGQELLIRAVDLDLMDILYSMFGTLDPFVGVLQTLLPHLEMEDFLSHRPTLFDHIEVSRASFENLCAGRPEEYKECLERILEIEGVRALSPWASKEGNGGETHGAAEDSGGGEDNGAGDGSGGAEGNEISASSGSSHDQNGDGEVEMASANEDGEVDAGEAAEAEPSC